MSEHINNGGPAFPCLDDAGSGLHLRECGMTLRDYFAAKAMAALICEPPFGDGMTAAYVWAKDTGHIGVDLFAAASYRMADAMLRAREVQA